VSQARVRITPLDHYPQLLSDRTGEFTVTGRPSITNDEAATGSRHLRNFGLVVAALCSVMFGLLFPLLHRRPIPRWPWTVAAVLITAALVRPALLYYFHAGWNALSNVLGWINTRLILGLVFYGLVTPMGLLWRLVRHPASGPTDASVRNSYRVDSHEIAPASFENPF
jgi:hypothetical protein